jgi:H+/gluconate symporter-like permease
VRLLRRATNDIDPVTGSVSEAVSTWQLGIATASTRGGASSACGLLAMTGSDDSLPPLITQATDLVDNVAFPFYNESIYWALLALPIPDGR